jgi:hypothetical protein
MQNLDLTGFDPHAPAPMTEAKREVIESGRTATERLVADLGDNPNERPLRCISELLVSLHITSGDTINETALGRALRQAGAPKRRIKVGCRQETVYAVRDYAEWDKRPNEEWNKQIAAQSSHFAGMYGAGR